MSGNLELYNDDCINILKEIEDNTIDLIITSPPYNLGHKNRKEVKDHSGIIVKYNSYGDNLPQKEYEEWQIQLLEECYRILKPTGLLYYNHKERHYKGYYFNPLNLIQESSFNPLQTIIWKRGGITFNIGRFVNCYETINVAYKSKDYMRINIESEKHFDIWDIPPDRNEHMVASFPLELPLRIIEAYTDYGKLNVLDPFMGTGTTGLACRMTDNNFIGCEIDKSTYEYATSRLKEYQTRLL